MEIDTCIKMVNEKHIVPVTFLLLVSSFTHA